MSKNITASKSRQISKQKSIENLTLIAQCDSHGTANPCFLYIHTLMFKIILNQGKWTDF